MFLLNNQYNIPSQKSSITLPSIDASIQLHVIHNAYHSDWNVIQFLFIGCVYTYTNIGWLMQSRNAIHCTGFIHIWNHKAHMNEISFIGWYRVAFLPSFLADGKICIEKTPFVLFDSITNLIYYSFHETLRVNNKMRSFEPLRKFEWNHEISFVEVMEQFRSRSWNIVEGVWRVQWIGMSNVWISL